MAPSIAHPATSSTSATFPISSPQALVNNKIPDQVMPPTAEVIGVPRQQLSSQSQQRQWSRQQEQPSMITSHQQQHTQFMHNQYGTSAGFANPMGVSQVAGNPYASMPIDYPPSFAPEIVQQLKALGEGERAYYEKVCQLQQFIGFLQSSLGKYQADPVMVGF